MVEKLKRNYKKFGNLQINELQLFSNNKLMVSLLTGSPCVYIKSQKVSDELQSIIISILDGLGSESNEVDNKKIAKLSDHERALFKNLMYRSGLSKDVKYKDKPRTISDMIERLKVLQGSIVAGNDSQIIINEAIELVKTLALVGKISPDDALELLQSLNDE